MRRFLSCLALLLASVSDAGGFDVTGQVLGINRAGFGWILLAGDAEPNNFNIDGRTAPDCRSGDIIRAQGGPRTDAGGKAYYLATNILILGKAPLPMPQDISGYQINDPALYTRCVRIRGIVSAVRRDDTNRAWNQLTLRTPSGRIVAVAQDDSYAFADLMRLVDSEVALSGYVTRFGAFLGFLGNELMLFEKGGITVIRNGLSDPFAAPPMTQAEDHRRLRIEGTVIGNDRHRIYLRARGFDFLPILPVEGVKRPPVGAHIVAAGFSERGMRGRQLADALVRVTSVGIVPTGDAVSVDPDTLFFDVASGTEAASTKFCGRLIRLTGTVGNSTDNIRQSGFLNLACGNHAVDADVSQFDGLADAGSLSGCRIAVSGLCIPSFERDAGSAWIPRFTGFTLIPRTMRDLAVLDRPSWWTPFRLLCVIGALAILLVVILVWNLTLRVMSERRGAQLARETIGRVRSELKVAERTRLAVELHDSISQTLTGVALQIDSATTANGAANGAVNRYLGLARQMLASCRKELQGCLWDLRGRTFEEKDLNEAILRAIGPQAGNARLTVRFNVPRECLSETTLHSLLRIARELVVNAVRHGQASEIRIAGELKDDILRFSVRDNGSGFDPATAPGPALGHFGLRGIRERLAEFDGTLEIDSRPGAETKFTVTLKIGDERDE